MKTKLAIILLFAFALACSMASAQTAPDQDNKAKIQAATDAAQKWLKLVDDGKYAESWEEAASMFKAQVTKEQWLSAMQQTRVPMGALKSRAFKDATYATKLPGTPDGEYVVIQFAASFTGLDSGVETITPVKDKDGKWRVTGYFIKPAE